MNLSVPAKDSSSTCISNPTVLPSPSQLFSLTPIVKVPPLVPTPAPALISPVGCSSTTISIIFKLFSDPSLTSYLLF